MPPIIPATSRASATSRMAFIRRRKPPAISLSLSLAVFRQALQTSLARRSKSLLSSQNSSPLADCEEALSRVSPKMSEWMRTAADPAGAAFLKQVGVTVLIRVVASFSISAVLTGDQQARRRHNVMAALAPSALSGRCSSSWFLMLLQFRRAFFDAPALGGLPSNSQHGVRNKSRGFPEEMRGVLLAP